MSLPGRLEKFELGEWLPTTQASSEKSGLLSFCRSKVFRNVWKGKAYLVPIFLIISLLLLLTSFKFLSRPSKHDVSISVFLLLSGVSLLVPSLYWLADLIGLIQDLSGGPRLPIVRTEDDYDSMLES